MELNDAARLAEDLMAEHGVEWGFGFDRAVRRFGAARFRKQMITLSRELTLRNDEDKVRETVLHEIAHVLAGAAAGHGRVWKLKCVELGIEPRRCYEVEDVEPVPLRYKATCDSCGKEYQRARRPNPQRTFYCGRHPRVGSLIWVDTKFIDPRPDLFGTSKFPKRKDPFVLADEVTTREASV